MQRDGPWPVLLTALQAGLHKRWRASAIRAFGADAVGRLAQRALAAAAAARVRPVVDEALTASGRGREDGDRNVASHRSDCPRNRTGRRHTREMQYRPGLLDDFIAETGLTVNPRP